MSVSLLPATLNEQCASAGVFDDESEAWIHFKTPADALVAQLHLQSRIPPRYIDAFLEVVRSAQFDASQVSFRKATDIDESVADCRRAQASQRAAFIKFPTTRLPYDVFPLIVEQIVQDRLPLRTTDPVSCFGKEAADESQVVRVSSRLQALALTHRSLTPLAQRALGQRIFLQTAEHLRALSRSPLLGPWTTELIVNLCFPSSELTPSEQSIDSVVAILRRAPRLRFLRIRTPLYLDADKAPCLQRLLAAVGMLTQLETLWWITPEHAARYAKADLEDVCRAVGAMPRLRSLVLRNARGGWTTLDADTAARMHNLESLSLLDINCPMDLRAPDGVFWILGSARPSLTSLSLDLTASTGALASVFASPIMPQLQTLRLRLARAPHRTFFADVFPPARTGAMKLHTLQLCLERPSSWTGAGADALRNMLAHVPPSVHVLQLVLFQLADLNGATTAQWAAQENELASFLESGAGSDARPLPLLNRVEITTPLQHWRWQWTRLQAACEQRGCTLDTRRAIQAGFA